MDELRYNIVYRLGDVYGDGHGGYEIMHLVANYPAEEIDKAYKKFVLKTGLDFTRDVCSEYEERYISEENLAILKEAGVVDDDYIKDYLIWDDDDPTYYLDLDTFIEIFEKIIRTELPDFKTVTRDLEEEEVESIEYAAYGLTEP